MQYVSKKHFEGCVKAHIEGINILNNRLCDFYTRYKGFKIQATYNSLGLYGYTIIDNDKLRKWMWDQGMDNFFTDYHWITLFIDNLSLEGIEWEK
jgi:hypothetical protein